MRDRYFYPPTPGTVTGIMRIDDEGIQGSVRENRVMDGPVVAAGILISRVGSYHLTGRQEYLDLAIRHAERFLAQAYEVNGALYFPYMYEWNLHQFQHAPMEVPWFSGMAQGYVLSSFSRLYEVTGNERYLNVAHKVFESFLQRRNDHPIWTTDLLEGKWFWIEEYVRNNGDSDRAFNGHIYATWGLHDYWMVTKDRRCELLFDGALTSLLHFLPLWRFPGGQSFYCMTHRERTAMYHAVHTTQMGYLLSISGSPIWARLIDTFITDYPCSIYSNAINHSVHIEPGTYRVFAGNGGLDLTESTDITFSEPLDIPFDVRGVMRSRLGPVVRASEGEHRNTWFTEEFGKIWANGPVDEVKWAHPITVKSREGALPELYQYDVENDRVEAQSNTAVMDSGMLASQRAKLNGRHFYKVSGGAADGLWVPVDSVEIP